MNTYTREEMAFFVYLIDSAKISYENAIKWSYDQFNDNYIPEWIERINIEADSRGIVEILMAELHLNESGFRIKYILGGMSNLYDIKLFKLSDIPELLSVYGFERLKRIDDKEINYVIWEIENASANYALAQKFWDEIELNFIAQLDRCEEYGNCSYKGLISS